MADNGRPPAYVSSSELGRHLGVTDVQVSYLARTGVLAREPDPTHPGRYKYELVTSLTCYINLLNARVEELRRHKRRQ
jgi:DNA-binding HxlR family transcriptional regulator